MGPRKTAKADMARVCRDKKKVLHVFISLCMYSHLSGVRFTLTLLGNQSSLSEIRLLMLSLMQKRILTTLLVRLCCTFRHKFVNSMCTGAVESKLLTTIEAHLSTPASLGTTREEEDGCLRSLVDQWVQFTERRFPYGGPVLSRALLIAVVGNVRQQMRSRWFRRC